MTNPLTRSLAALFRSKAEVTSLSRLAREGIRSVNVVDVAQLEEIVIEAVERVLPEFSGNGSSPEKVADGAQVELLKLLGARGRLHQRDDDLARGERALEGDLGRLRGELATSRRRLEESVERAARETMAELRKSLDVSLTELFERARSDVERAAPGASAGLAALKSPLRDALLALLATALQRGVAEPASAPAMEVELLERRVKKLTAQLDETQQLLARVRDEKSAEEAGVASIYRSVQGLRGDEQNVERRRALMREIFRHNWELRNSEAET